MKKNALYSLAFFACLVSLSCRKSDRNNDKEVISVLDNIMAINFINDLYNQVMEGASLQTELNKVQSTCATYTVTDPVNAISYTENFYNIKKNLQ